MDGCSQRVMVSGSVSSWRLVMRGLPQGSVLGLGLFSTFSGDTDRESRFAAHTKLRVLVTHLKDFE